MAFPTIAAAAASLRLCPSALSHQFRRLERDVGAKLYQPATSRRPWRPTGRGATLLTSLARPDTQALAAAHAPQISGRAGSRYRDRMPISLGPDAADARQAASLFRVLAHPTRLAILLTLQTGEQRITDLAAQLGGSQANISAHLTRLKKSGLITSRPQGRAVYYRLTRPELSSLLDAAGQLTAPARAAGPAGTGTAAMKSPGDRDKLRQTFNQAAGSYHQARPDYPSELFDDLTTVAGLAPGDPLLEIGCATGKATVPLARRGFRITCIEPGPDLAAAARRNLARMGTDIIQGRFEDWQPTPGQPFDLVFAATAWNWIDPARRYALAWRALRPGGHLAFWDALHVLPDDGDPFFREIQDVYDEIGEGLPPGSAWPRPGELPDQAAEINASGLFEVMHIRHFDWEQVYDADSYIELLNTFSGHIAMQDWKRERLYGEIRRRLSRRPGNAVRRHWEAVLHISRRRD